MSLHTHQDGYNPKKKKKKKKNPITSVDEEDVEKLESSHMADEM